MNAIIKPVIILLGGGLTFMLSVLALSTSSLTYALQAVTALAVTVTLFQSISKKQALSQSQTTRNQKMIVIGLLIGLLVPALVVWLIVYNAHHN